MRHKGKYMAESTSHIASEPVLAYSTNTYADVMTMLHSMPMDPQVKEQVGRRLVLEVTGRNLSKAFSRLDHLAGLQDGWAGDGSYAVSHRVLNNLKSVLLISDDDDWKDWMIAPDVNATLVLQSKQSNGCISVGTDEFSYYAEKDGREYHASHEQFSPDAVLEIMRTIV